MALMPEARCADKPRVTTHSAAPDPDQPETDSKDLYSEMVLRSYDDLFEPWLKPDPDKPEEGSGDSKA